MRLLIDLRLFSSCQLIVSVERTLDRELVLSWLLDCLEGGTAPGGGPSLLPRELTMALLPKRRLLTVSEVGDVGTPTTRKIDQIYQSNQAHKGTVKYSKVSSYATCGMSCARGC